MRHKDKEFTIRAAAATSTGLVRQSNEDNFFLDGAFMTPSRAEECGKGVDSFPPVAGGASALFAVFDGMGGEDCGEVASAMSAAAADVLRGQLLRPRLRPAEWLIRRFYINTDAAVARKARELGAQCVGCTGATLWLSGGHALAMNAGDSRIYLLRGGAVGQLTHDHTQSQRLVDCGEFTREEAANFPRSHAIWQFIGMSRTACMSPAPFVRPAFRLRDGDVFILCSDGLTDMLGDAEIARITTDAERDPEAIAHALVQAALEAGGYDNCTVIAVCVGRNEEPAAQASDKPSGDAPQSTSDTAAADDAPNADKSE